MRRSKKKKDRTEARVTLHSLDGRLVFVKVEEYESLQEAHKQWSGGEDFFAVCFDDGKGYRPVTKVMADSHNKSKVAFFPLFQMPGSAEAFARDRRIALKNKVSTNKLTKFKVVRGTLDDFRTVLDYLSDKESTLTIQVNMAIVWPYQTKDAQGDTEELEILDVVDQLHLN